MALVKALRVVSMTGDKDTQNKLVQRLNAQVREKRERDMLHNTMSDLYDMRMQSLSNRAVKHKKRIDDLSETYRKRINHVVDIELARLDMECAMLLDSDPVSPETEKTPGSEECIGSPSHVSQSSSMSEKIIMLLHTGFVLVLIAVIVAVAFCRT